MHISGHELNNNDLLRYTNPSALFGARRIKLADGRGKGHRLVEVKTAAGLRLTLSESRCLDIVEAEYKGINLGFLSKNGIADSPLYSPETTSFTKYWQGGFLATCGLRNVGGDCEIAGEYFPIHGHIGQTTADEVNITTTEDTITISGKIRETALFGHCFEMFRTITVPTDGAKITVKDSVRNLTPEEHPVFLMYHINFGFPFLSEHLQLNFPPGEVRGRTDEAQQRIDSHTTITPPIDGEPEYVYFHTPTTTNPTVTLTNPSLGITAEVSYNKTNLPVLAQWKCMRSGDYALGIEPTTGFVRGRKEELANGYDKIIPPFGEMDFGVDIALT